MTQVPEGQKAPDYVYTMGADALASPEPFPQGIPGKLSGSIIPGTTIRRSRQCDYAESVFTKLHELSYRTYVESEEGDTKIETQWQGSLSKLIKETCPQAHPGKVATYLKGTDAITMLQRGGRATNVGAGSLYRLNRLTFYTHDDGRIVDLEINDWIAPSAERQRRQQYSGMKNRIEAVESNSRKLPELVEMYEQQGAELRGLREDVNMLANTVNQLVHAVQQNILQQPPSLERRDVRGLSPAEAFAGMIGEKEDDDGATE